LAEGRLDVSGSLCHYVIKTLKEVVVVDVRMGVAEVKRRFADVVGQVVHGGKRVIVERRGRPVVAIVPLDDADALLRPGQRLAAVAASGEAGGESFRELMGEVVKKRRRRPPRRLAERPR
jgi:prevent-host-death family protein